MTLVKWNPTTLDREINNLVSNFWGDTGPLKTNAGWNPKVDVAEFEDRYEVHADLPGLSKEDINVTLEKGVLAIEGEKKRSSETKSGDYLRTERDSGKFSRTFNIGDRVDASKISAAYKDGVLTLGLPKAEVVKPKAIEVKVS
jgi:HSP20 family protein